MKTIAGMARFLTALGCSQDCMQRAALEIRPLPPCSNVSICCNSICSSDPHPSLGPSTGGARKASSPFARGNRCRKKDGVPHSWLNERQLELKGARLVAGYSWVWSRDGNPTCRRTGAPSFWPQWVSIKCEPSFLDLGIPTWGCSFPLEVALGYFSYFW